MSKTGHRLALLTLPLAALLGPGGLTLPSPALAQTLESASERNRQLIEQAFARWSAGGGTFFEDVLAPDATWTIKGTSPAAGTYHGREDFLRRAVQPFADRMSTALRPTVNGIWADGDVVIAHWDGVGTAADGEPYSNSYVWIFRMADQRAINVVAFLDLVPYDEVLRRVPESNKESAR